MPAFEGANYTPPDASRRRRAGSAVRHKHFMQSFLFALTARIPQSRLKIARHIHTSRGDFTVSRDRVLLLTVFFGRVLKMTQTFFKLISKLLIVAMLAFPFQAAQAGLVGTDQVGTAQQTQGSKDRVIEFLSRGDVKSQLQTMGISPDVAKDRVNALTDEELQRIANKIDSLPAGATSGWAWVLVIAIVVWIWYAYK